MGTAVYHNPSLIVLEVTSRQKMKSLGLRLGYLGRLHGIAAAYMASQ